MSDLFSATYNPDVLSCLANLSNDEVFTPPEVVNQMLDMLPKEIWADKNATFLDPACKSGVFLREIAKRLIEAQLPNYEQISYEINEKLRAGSELDGRDIAFQNMLAKVIEHVFKNQVFGIAITELTSLLSRRSVYCSKYPQSEYSVVRFDNPEGRIDYKQMQHTWKNGKCAYCGASEGEYDREEGKEQYAYEFIHLDNPEEVFDMKFDVIIGNPPYQMSDGGNQASAKPIYQLFVQQAMKLNPRYLTMIIPARWFAGGKGLDEFRSEMLADKRIRILHDFLNSQDCFGTSVEIKSGVCYFLWERDCEGLCHIITHGSNGNVSESNRYLQIGDSDVYIRQPESISILEKVLAHDEEGFDSLVSSRKPFGLPTSYAGHDKKQNESDIQLIRRGGSSWVSKKEVSKNVDWIDKSKIYITKAYNAGDIYPHQIINKPIIGMPNTCCTETYIVVAPGYDAIQLANIMNYMSTKFFRFLVSLRKISQDATSKVYKFAPVQDFSKSWTDEELYEKYGITDEEQAFIDSLIRPMEI